MKQDETNCLLVRRQLLTDPRRLDEEAERHLARCFSCAASGEKLRAVEQAIEHTVQIPVPDGLADRILLRALKTYQGARHGAPTWSQLMSVRVRVWKYRLALLFALRNSALTYPRAIALGISAIVILGVTLIFSQVRKEDAIISAAIAHVVNKEQDELEAHPAYDPTMLRGLLAESGVRLPTDVREVHYLGRCAPPAQTGEHIVFTTRYGKVSVILWHNQPLIFRFNAAALGMSAVAKPARAGSIAVIAASTETANAVAGMLR